MTIRLVFEPTARGGGGTERVDPHPDSTKIFLMRSAIAEADEARIAARVMEYQGTFPSPVDVARAARVRLRMADLPPQCRPEMTDGATVYYRWHPDQRELGTRLFRGIAAALLERHRGEHTDTDASFLAARLAAPPLLVHRVGLERAIDRQQWVTERFLRAWWAAM